MKFTQEHKDKIGKALRHKPKTHGATVQKINDSGAAYRSWEPEYTAWHGMLDRCYNKKTKNWKAYGGRGIRVCKEWRHSFETFFAHVGKRPSAGHSLDRIDVNGNYEPGNVRWATAQEQRLNQRDIKKLTYKGETLPVISWAERLNIRPKTILARISAGWSIKDALTKPVDKKRKRPKMKLTSKDMWLRTYNNHKFHPFSPKQEDVDIIDIGHALANICRFSGHTHEYYSVAEHSYRVSLLVPEEHALYALLHDAPEAYFGDMVTPIKHHPNMGFYRYSESRLMKLISKKYGLTTEQPECVTKADRLMLATEARDLVGNPVWAEGMEKLPDKIKPMLPKKAEKKFIERFNYLIGKRLNKG